MCRYIFSGGREKGEMGIRGERNLFCVQRGIISHVVETFRVDLNAKRKTFICFFVFPSSTASLFLPSCERSKGAEMRVSL